MNAGEYRPCVGIMLVNADGKAFVGRRIDNKEGDWWQMPQGGVDEGEDPAGALARELYEETGIPAQRIEVLGQLPDEVFYDLPSDLKGKLWGGRYIGQRQTWFCCRFTGEDSEVNLEAHDPPEFCDWRWVEPDQLPELIVPFKKPVYEAVVAGFRRLL